MSKLGLFGVSGLASDNQGPHRWFAESAPTAAATANPVASGPNWGDISGYYDKALASLSGDTEKMYQQGKRRTLSDIAMQSINSGMANTLNMPAAGVAYDEANRPATNLALGEAKANILTGLGQTAAGMYGQNLASQTSMANARLGSDTSLTSAQLGFQTNAAQMALDKYLGELRNKTANRELSLRAAGGF
jgi:hypothetical protein